VRSTEFRLIHIKTSYLRESLVEEIPFLNRHLAHLDIRKRAVMQMDDLPKGI
jgi:primosomal protein N''